jgi:hypothetical protein
MISADPPKRATWLLEHAGSRYRRESLAGDLIEEYRAGRSDAWYWRQVLWAIAASVGHAVRAVLPAWLALLTWWGVLLLFSFLWKWPAIIFALDPSIYWLYRARHKRRASLGSCAP